MNNQGSAGGYQTAEASTGSVDLARLTSDKVVLKRPGGADFQPTTQGTRWNKN